MTKTASEDWRDVVLRLMSDRPGADATPIFLRDADWAKVEEAARLHRLGPMLHTNANGTQKGADVPGPLKRRWAAAYLQGKRRSLAIAREIAVIDETARAQGIAYALLKGPQLAWACYPDPALRPMRDLDILAARSDALRLQEALIAQGYQSAEATAHSGNLDQHKHLTPLVSQNAKVTVEIHHSVVTPGNVDAHRTMDAEDLLSRTIDFAIDGRLYPALDPSDALLHFVLHGAYEHFFGAGPLVLSDVAWLVRRSAIDWTRFWSKAEAAGAAGGAAILFALTCTVFDCPGLFENGRAEEVGAPLIKAARSAMLRGWTEQYASLFAGELSAAGSIGNVMKIVRRRIMASGSGLVASRVGGGASGGPLAKVQQAADIFRTLWFYASTQAVGDARLRRLLADRSLRTGR